MASTQPTILYENRFNDATPAASSTAAGFNVLNLRDWRNYTWWKPTSLPATVTVDCGSAKAADYLFVAGHDLATQGATLEGRSSTDNFATNDVLRATKTPSNNKPFLVQFSSASARYWRLTIPAGPSVIPQLAIAVMGAALVVPGYCAPGFDPLGRDGQGQFNKSQKGNPLGVVLEYEEWKQSVEFQSVQRSWVDANWVPAWNAHLRSSPFGFAWSPTDYPSDLFVVNVDGRKFDAPQQQGGLVHLKFTLTGVYP